MLCDREQEEPISLECILDVIGNNPFNGARVANLSPAFALKENLNDMGRGVVVLGRQHGSFAESLSTPYAAQVAAEDAGKKAAEHGMKTLEMINYNLYHGI